MQQSSFLGSSPTVSQPTSHVLIIDDNVQLRSLLARHVMLSSNNHDYSCAIYRLGERAEPDLTFYNNPLDPTETYPRLTAPAFAVYEAGSPRHALNWIKQTGISHLTIISDVMMPVDTEVGLPGLLNGLHHLRVAVNLVFISSEPQNIEQVEALLKGLPAYFLIKGSEAWSQLPEALVNGVSRFRYQLLPNADYSNPFLFHEPDLMLQRRSQIAAAEAAARQVTQTESLRQKPRLAPSDYINALRGDASASSPATPTGGVRLRLFGLLSRLFRRNS